MTALLSYRCSVCASEVDEENLARASKLFAELTDRAMFLLFKMEFYWSTFQKFYKVGDVISANTIICYNCVDDWVFNLEDKVKKL